MLLPVVVGLFVVPAAAEAPDRGASGFICALAWVDSRVLTDLDVARWLGRSLPRDASERLRDDETAALVDLSITWLETREARHRGAEVTPAMVTRAFAARVKAVGGPDRFRDLLRRSPATANDIRKDCEDRLLVRHLYLKKLPGSVVGGTAVYGRVGPAEVREHYRRHREEFRRPGRARVALIEIRDPDFDVGKEKATRAVTRLRGGADFSAFARAESQGPRAGRGGDLGWIEKERLDPSIDDFAFSATTGAISEPVLSPGGGWWIVRLVEREPGLLRPFEEAQEEIAVAIRSRRLTAVRRVTLRRLIDEASIHPAWLRTRMLEAAATIGEPARF